MESFRARLKRGDFMVAGGAYDTLSAKIIEEAGYDAIWVGSLVGTASLLGSTDIGLMTARERAEQVSRIGSTTPLPVFVDGETGWGDSPQVAFWAREFERAGAAGMMLEDKKGDFNTPYVKGSLNEIEEAEVAVRKIRAAVDVRESPDFLIIARSAARRKYGMGEQLRRLKLYKRAGADIIWASSNHPDLLTQYREAIEGPLWATCNVNSGEQSRLRTADFKRRGIQIVGHETPIYLCALKATVTAARRLKKGGSVMALKDEMLDFEEFTRLAGFGSTAKLAKRYGLVH